MSAARHDLCRAAEGDLASHRVRRRSRNRREISQRHQRARCLYGRHAVHDDERHVHRQRHRARHRFADASFAGRVLRSRQRQEPFLGQALIRGAHYSLSRLLARYRIRRQRHRICAYRPAPEDSGIVLVLRAGDGRRGGARDLLQDADLRAARRQLASAFRCRADEGHEGKPSISSMPRLARSCSMPARN